MEIKAQNKASYGDSCMRSAVWDQRTGGAASLSCFSVDEDFLSLALILRHGIGSNQNLILKSFLIFNVRVYNIPSNGDVEKCCDNYSLLKRRSSPWNPLRSNSFYHHTSPQMWDPLFRRAQEKKNSNTWQPIEGDSKPVQKIISVHLKQKKTDEQRSLEQRECGDVPKTWKKQQIRAKEKAYHDGPSRMLSGQAKKCISMYLCMMFPVCVIEYVHIITASLALTRSNSYSVYGWTHLSYG